MAKFILYTDKDDDVRLKAWGCEDVHHGDIIKAHLGEIEILLRAGHFSVDSYGDICLSDGYGAPDFDKEEVDQIAISMLEFEMIENQPLLRVVEKQRGEQ